MNYKKRILYAFLILLTLFVSNIFISTGYFRTITYNFEGQVLKKIKLNGAEDIAVSRKDSFAIVSATARNKFPNTKQEIGDLFFIDLKNDEYKPICLTKEFKKPFAPHGLSVFQHKDVTVVAVINHTLKGDFIEIFKLIKGALKHQKTLKNKMILSANDIVLLDESKFYFTNDHKYKKGFGRLLEDYLGLSVSNVIYFDGVNYTVIADDIAFANGINIDVKRNLVFVASPRKFLVKVYQKNDDNSLTFIEDINCKTGVDNIEIDEKGNLWIGAHPNLFQFAAYAKGTEKYAPSEIIKINYQKKGDYSIEQIYMEKGALMSASTVAVPFNNIILVGNVMDNKFLILENPLE